MIEGRLGLLYIRGKRTHAARRFPLDGEPIHSEAHQPLAGIHGYLANTSTTGGI
jgi:hypothetical protein